MSDYHQYLTTKYDSEKRLWITLRTFDTLSSQTAVLLKELNETLQSAAQDASLQGIIITSEAQTSASQTAKPPTQFSSTTSLQALATTLELAQIVGQRLIQLSIPSVVILSYPISMHTMSLAIAATYCISSYESRAKLIFKEIKHGLHPSMLSTQQVIRRMGTANALHYLLSGETLTPARALQLNLIDACVAKTELHTTATDLIDNKPSRQQAEFAQRLRTLSPFRKVLNFDLHDKVLSIGKQADYPAPHALLHLWEQYGLDSHTNVQQAYNNSIKELSQTQQAFNLSRVSRLAEHLQHIEEDEAESTIKHIYLIGFGEKNYHTVTSLLLKNARVTLHSQNAEEIAQTLPQIRRVLSQQKASDTHQLQNMMNNLSHDRTGEMIGEADLILVTDDLSLMDSQELFAALEEKTRPDSILAVHSNTLPLDKIASVLLNPQRLLGLHFCRLSNSPDTELVEIAFSQQTNRERLNKTRHFLRRTGYMTLTTPGRPGQLVNRILLHYVLQGVRLHQQGVPQAYIDRAGQSCGMKEGPLELADKLGLDNCLNLAETLKKTKHTIEIPYSLYDKVKAGTLGIKSGSGFYRYRNGNRLKTERIQWNGSEQALQEKLVGQICEEAAICLEEGLLDNPDIIDAGIIFGAGFMPYTGGPLYQQRNTVAGSIAP